MQAMAAVTTLTVRKAILLALLWLSHYSGTALAQQEIVTLSDAAGRDAVVFSNEHPERSPGSGGFISGFRRLDPTTQRKRQDPRFGPGQFSRA